MTTQLTKNYWLDVFMGWIESRDIPGPQNDEAMKVIDELRAAEARADSLAAQLVAEKAAHESDVAALNEIIKQLERELKYFHSTDLASDAAMAHYYDDETPLGQQLDGSGDEVEG